MEKFSNISSIIQYYLRTIIHLCEINTAFAYTCKKDPDFST